ncbi:MAG: NAD-dependent epimerase/dehydratase family protein [Planctomycetaceae bacterium]|nr:NAD-dependent epimerase/dehydratase family protein [Planctomycetaceae bacterium]
MHALVTGGSGFLGRYIVERLVARGDRVRSLSRWPPDDLASERVDVVRGDIRDARTVADACRGVEAVFHTAAVPRIWGPKAEYHEINVGGTMNVLAGCREHGVGRLVFTSSPSVVFDGRPHAGANESLPYAKSHLAVYPQTKALAEHAVLDANGMNGLATVALRPHLIFGPGDPHLLPRVVQRAMTGRLRRVGDGTNLVSVSYVENSAAAHLQACDALAPGAACAGKAYFINEPQPVNLWDFINDVLQRAGVPPITKSIPAGIAWRIGGMLEATYRLLRLPGEPRMTRFMAAQLSSSHWYDISGAIRDFGYNPQISIAEGLRRTEPDLKHWATLIPKG